VPHFPLLICTILVQTLHAVSPNNFFWVLIELFIFMAFPCILITISCQFWMLQWLTYSIVQFYMFWKYFADRCNKADFFFWNGNKADFHMYQHT
jgi:hypothetical protein